MILGILLATTLTFKVPSIDCSGCANPVAKTLDIRAFDGSRPIDFKAIAAPGKITIVDFYADWCGPCKVLELRMQHLVQGKNIAVRRVNMGKWDNAAAKQATRDFRLASLPYLRIYDGSGKLAGEIRDGMWNELLDAVEKASR